MRKLKQKIKGFLYIFFIIAIPFSGFAREDIPKTKIQERSFSETNYNSLKKEKKYKAFLNYKNPINKNESKLKRFLLRTIEILLNNRLVRFVITVFPYLLIIVAFILIILRLSNVEFSRLLKPNLKNKDSKVIYDDENIYEIDIDKLLKSAIELKDYRLAIRYNFLKTLRFLSDQEKIKWEVYKTNYDYQCELKKENYYPFFCELTRYFEFMWYGEFKVDLVKYYSESISLSNKIIEEFT